MPKKSIDISQSVMNQITSGHLHMRPRWYFVVGSISLFLAIFGLFVFSVYSVSLISFSLRSHGPMGELRFQQLVTNFPYWSAVLAVLGLFFGIKLLKKYDFSYRQNFAAIILIFIILTIISGILIDILNIRPQRFSNFRQGRMINQSQQRR